MDLGRFSLSLTVKDLAVSREFYAKLGFEVVPGEDFATPSGLAKYNETWVILSNGPDLLGLFQGMFDKNTMTWNPTDVRSVQKRLKKAGIEMAMEADEDSTGPAAAMVFDPDGNPILLDQHDEQGDSP